MTKLQTRVKETYLAYAQAIHKHRKTLSYEDRAARDKAQRELRKYVKLATQAGFDPFSWVVR